MNAVSGAPCSSCGFDGRADIIDRATEGPVPLGFILECSLCGDHYMWLLDVPASPEEASGSLQRRGDLGSA